jgi:hypothetical protein
MAVENELIMKRYDFLRNHAKEIKVLYSFGGNDWIYIDDPKEFDAQIDNAMKFEDDESE